MTIKRVKTGIKGFDELIEGGFPEGNCILLTGTPGTGKTIFGLQFLYNGVVKYKEKGLFVSIGTPVKAIAEQASLFGWDIRPLDRRGDLQLLYLSTKSLDQNIASIIGEKVKKDNIKRLVIDSVSILAINAPLYRSLIDISVVELVRQKSIFAPPVMGDTIVKKFIYGFIEDTRSLGVTSVLISESSEKGEFLSRDTISEFVCDGIIPVSYTHLTLPTKA